LNIKSARVAPFAARGAIALSVLTLAGFGLTTSSSAATSTAASLSGEPVAVRNQLETLYKEALSHHERTVAVDTLNVTAFQEPNQKGEGELVALFEKLFPRIKVEPIDVETTPIDERIAAENKTGKYVSDVALTTSTDLLDLEQAGDLAEFLPANASQELYPADYSDPKGEAYEVAQAFNGLVYNTSKLSASQVPTTWKELAEPQWHDKFAILGPDQDTAQEYIAESLYMGDFNASEFEAAVGNAQITNNQITYESKVSDGQYEFNVFGPAVLALSLKAEGQPLGFVGGQVTVPTSIWTSVLAHAPDPYAARLYDAFELSNEAQNKTATGTYFDPSIKGVALNPVFAGIKRPAQIPFNQVPKYLAQAAKLASPLYPAGSATAS
jgi:ABC-type Fe3+ transport system substrate-binding protein